MKYRRTTILWAISFSIMLFITGLFTYEMFFNLVVPEVSGAFYQVIAVNGVFWRKILFSFVLALVPFFILFTWKFSSLNASNKKFATVLLVLICMVLVIIARQQSIRYYLDGLTKNLTNKADKVQVSYPVDELYFEYFMFAGLCAGCVLSYFLLRPKKLK